MRWVAVLGSALFAYAVRSHVRGRRVWPPRLAACNAVTLRSTQEVELWLETSS